jgi:hypothetical protein
MRLTGPLEWLEMGYAKHDAVGARESNMRRVTRLCLVGGLGLALSAGLGRAPRSAAFAAADDTPVLTSASLDELKEACTGLGLKPRETKDAGGDPSLSLYMGDAPVTLLLSRREDRIVSLGLEADFKPADPPTLDTINAWNTAQRFSRAYVANGSATLEDDLDLQGGVTWKTVSQFLTRFQKRYADFARHIGFQA